MKKSLFIWVLLFLGCNNAVPSNSDTSLPVEERTIGHSEVARDWKGVNFDLDITYSSITLITTQYSCYCQADYQNSTPSFSGKVALYYCYDTEQNQNPMCDQLSDKLYSYHVKEDKLNFCEVNIAGTNINCQELE